jgi:phenylacetate-CoA ligase
MFYIRQKLADIFGIGVADRVKGLNVKKYYDLFISSLDWSRDRIEAYQTARLKFILKQAYKQSEFFSKRIDDAGFDIDNFKYPDEIRKLPALTRSDLQNNLYKIVSKDFNLKDCSKGSSSGSTGHPVIYYHDKNGTSANKASAIFSKYLGGYKPGNRWINIWGNPTAVNFEWNRTGSKVKKLFMNELRFPAYRLNNKEEFEILYKIFLTKQPDFVYGYTNAIFLFARFLEEKKLKLNFIKGVFTTAENLHSYQKELIEEVIGSVYDHYGCSEINGIAVQSVYDNYYSIIDPHVFVEFGDTVDKKNNVRKIIVTDLYNVVLPFIRYENGDLVVPAEIKDYGSYRLKYSKIRSVDGRQSDIIALPGGGNLVVPSFFGSRMLKNVSGIKQYQVQKTKEKIIVNLIVTDDFKDESRQVILNTLNEYIPAEINYELVFNQDIIYSDNGKFKLFVDNSPN